MKNHEKAFSDIKNYYNDITLNNLALINSLKVVYLSAIDIQLGHARNVSVVIGASGRYEEERRTYGEADG